MSNQIFEPSKRGKIIETEYENEINKIDGVSGLIKRMDELFNEKEAIKEEGKSYEELNDDKEAFNCHKQILLKMSELNRLEHEYISLVKDKLTGRISSPISRIQSGIDTYMVKTPDGEIQIWKYHDNSDKFANDPIDCYKYRDSDLTKGPKTLQHEKEVAAESSLPYKLYDDWDKHNDEEEKIYGPEFVDVKLYINELFKLQLAGVDKTYKCTDFVKSDKPLKEVSVESEMERAIKRRGELFREGNHRKFLAENNITELPEEELQALPKSVASEKVIVDKRPQAECGCPETSQFFINKNNTYMRVCKDCKKKGNHLVNYVCDGCKIPQMNKKFAYLNKDNQPVCQLCK